MIIVSGTKKSILLLKAARAARESPVVLIREQLPCSQDLPGYRKMDVRGVPVTGADRTCS